MSLYNLMRGQNPFADDLLKMIGIELDKMCDQIYWTITEVLLLMSGGAVIGFIIAASIECWKDSE